MSTRPPSLAAAPRPLAPVVFAVAWAAATLFHQVAFVRVASVPIEGALSLAALWVLLQPRRSVAFATLLGVQVVEIGWRAPFVSNHWWISMFAAITMLLALVPTLRTRAFSASGWREHFAPVLRVMLLLVYVWGVLHKLNRDFLDPQVSCGYELYRALRDDFLPFLPTGSAPAWLAIAGTLAVETAIPVLLIVPRGRAWGVLLGASFHFMLGFVPYSVYYNFSSMLFALFLLFTDESWLEACRKSWQSWGTGRRRTWLVRSMKLAVVAFVVAAAIDGPRHRDTWRFAARIPWAMYGTVAITAFAWARRSSPTRGAAPALLRPWRWSVGWLAIAFALNGASPYLGLKTETSLAMYSNLRTEGGESNHLWFGPSLDLVGWQRDVVQIENSNLPEFRRLRARGYALVWFELADRLAREPRLRVSYTRGGERLRHGPGDANAPDRAPTWLRKLVRFRPVELRHKQRCVH